MKRKVLALLKSDNFDRSLDELCQWPARQVINPLFSFLLSIDEQTKWRAITAMGTVVANLASHEGLAKEYAPILISYVWEEGNFLEYEPLQRGALWGIGRVAQVRPELVQDACAYLLPYMKSIF